MSRAHVNRWVAVVAAMMAMAVLTAVPAGAADGGITGTVTGAGGAGPLANVQVCAGSVGNSGFGCDTTGADGVYDIGSLPPQSDYRVRFE